MSDTCTPMTVHSGPADCVDGECDELVTEEGEPTGIDRCSHLTDEQVCEKHSTFSDDEWGYCTHAEPWPCQHAAIPQCQQPDCAARTWGSCAHCTRPYCADHLTPVGEYGEPVCADDLAASASSV